MKWNKTNVHHALRMYDLLENHAFDAFYFWWEQQHGEFKPNTPEWDNFWEGMNTLNDGTFFNFDWETEEWVINKGGEEYRFPRSWLYEELQDEPDLVMLWHAGYYDGPLNGMALYNGQYVWFDCFSDDYQEPYYGMRVYRLYELSEKEMKEQFNHHSKFRKYVGHHTDYGSAYAPFEGKSREEMDKFYKDPKRIQPSKNFTKNKMLGEFTDVQFRRDRPLSSKTQEGTVSDE